MDVMISSCSGRWFKIGLSASKKFVLFENDENDEKGFFISSWELFSFSRYLSFLPRLFDHARKTAWLER